MSNSYINRTKTKFKGLTFDYDKVVADENEDQCYRLSSKTVRILLSMIDYIGWSTRWTKADNSPLSESEIDNIKTWEGRAALELMSPQPCFDKDCEDGDCIAYYPTNPKFTFAPNDPFNPPETPPAGYLSNPLVAGYSSGIPGSEPNDIYCTIPTLLPAPPLGLIDQILASGFPRVHFEFSGSGEVEVHLIEVPLGGLAIVRIDDTAYVQVVNLLGISLDDILISLDFIIEVLTGVLNWKFISERTLEFSVPNGDHTCDILFIPNLSFDVLESGWGGGLRKIVLCGDFTTEDCPETIFDPIGGGNMAGLFGICWFTEPDGSKILRWTQNGGCTWEDVGECSDSVPIVIDPVDPVDPVDYPGGIGDPKPGEACKITEIAFEHAFNSATDADLLGNFWYLVMSASTTVADIPAALNTFLINFGDPTYANVYAYFDAFNRLALEQFPNKTHIDAAWDGSIWADYIRCVVYKQLVGVTSITRELLNSMADEIESLSVSEDVGYALRFAAAFMRIYPLSDIRRRAYIASYDAGTYDCSDCDEPPVGDCADMLVQFEDISEPYNMTVGILDFAKTGKGVKSVIVPNTTFPNPNGYPLCVGLNVEFFPPSACSIREFAFRYRNIVGNPEPAANNNLIDVWWNLAVWNGATLVYSQTFNNKGIYYYNLATSWPRLKHTFTTPITGDKLILSTWQYATSITRILKQWIDDVEILMATS